MWHWGNVSPSTRQPWTSRPSAFPLVGRQWPFQGPRRLSHDSSLVWRHIIPELRQLCAEANRERLRGRIWRASSRIYPKGFLFWWWFKVSPYNSFSGGAGEERKSHGSSRRFQSPQVLIQQQRSNQEHPRTEGVKEIDLDLDKLPLERTLGVQWCVESDSFEFNIVLQDKPCTRRGILSTVSSVYYPKGFVAPLMLQGKAILQELCVLNLDWNEPVPEEAEMKWERWRMELMKLQSIKIPRCYKPSHFRQVIRAELHHFSDTSVQGYGQCSYQRLEDEAHNVHWAFVMGKSRVDPLKPVTIPPLELTAAVCSVKRYKIGQIRSNGGT